MAKSENLFSVVFRGFSREEVIVYMEEMNRTFRENTDGYEARIAALTKELEESKALKDRCETLEKQLEEKDASIREAKEENERLREDVDNVRAAVTASEERAAALEATLETTKTELAAEKLKSAAMEENAKEYDTMLADVNGILSTARRKAEELIDEAGTHAERIVEEAGKKAKTEAEDIVAASEEKVADNMKKVKYLYRRQDELSEIFKDHKNKVDAFFASLPLLSGEEDKGESK